LLALPLAPGDSRIRLTTRLESRPYVDLTLEVMKRFGVTAEGVGDDAFEVRGGQSYQPADYLVEADYSQAAFFLAAAALGRPARCAGLDPSSRQGDRAILSILAEMGATVGWESGEAVVRAGVLRAVEADVRETPDLAPVLAVLCALGDGVSRIVGAARLRLKECDRLKAMASELRKLGADIEEGEDSLTITGRPSLTGGRVDAHNDHRVAMALAVAAIGCDGPVYLTGWRSVDKSYPSFWDDFERAGR
jgi:3-phosphoshikimate 1-carboxyvinyltransferase